VERIRVRVQQPPHLGRPGRAVRDPLPAGWVRRRERFYRQWRDDRLADTARRNPELASTVSELVGDKVWKATADTVNAVVSFGNAALRNPAETTTLLLGIWEIYAGGAGILGGAGGCLATAGAGCIPGVAAITASAGLVTAGVATVGISASSLAQHANGDSRMEVMNRNGPDASEAGGARGYEPDGAAADYDIDELAQLTYQHVGAGDLPNRPSYGEIREALQRGTAVRIDGQNSVRVEFNGVRVIVNEDLPLRSTSYYVGR